MVTSISASITQNAGQSQNIGQPTSSSSGIGGLADSSWPMFRQNLNHTGLSPYNTSGNNGQLKWDFQTGDRVSSPAIGSDGTIYVGSRDNNLYAINPNGTEKWNFTSTASSDYSSPAIGSDGTIYTGFADRKLSAINPDGTEKWDFMIGAPITSSPSIGSDGTIYIGSDDHKMYAINPDGTKKWSFMAGESISSSPAIDLNGTIYTGSNDYKLYAINPDGTQKWTFTTGHYVASSPAIGSDGIIFVGSYDHKLYAINPDGSQKWNFTTGHSITSSPIIGPNGTVYAGSVDRIFYAIGNILPNQLPSADAGPDQTVNEDDVVQLDGTGSNDPDGSIESYEWDFDIRDGLWWNTGAVPDATGPTPTHVYGDDGVFIVTLRITDNDNLSATDTCNVTVLNVNPTVTMDAITMDVEIGLRVAGRKYNNVSMTLFEDGYQLGNVSIERLPGSPDEQMAWIPVSINFSKFYSATVTYTPKEPLNVGANPVWICIKSQNGSIKKIHHTFNVQQSKKRDSDQWNHVEPWEVDLNAALAGYAFELTCYITDPGSDDETVNCTYGSQNIIITHLNNPPDPDPYPSPDMNPVDISGTIPIFYEGPGSIVISVKDDDGGITVISIDLV